MNKKIEGLAICSIASMMFLGACSTPPPVTCSCPVATPAPDYCAICMSRYNIDANDCFNYTQGIQNPADRDRYTAMCLRNKGYSAVGRPCDNVCGQ